MQVNYEIKINVEYVNSSMKHIVAFICEALVMIILRFGKENELE
jgi:hypothetical protein